MNASADAPPRAPAAVAIGRVLWRLGAFAVAWILVQGIVESLAGPLFAALSRAIGEPVPMYPYTMLAGCAGGCWVGLRLQFEAPWSLAGVTPGAWRPRPLLVGVALGTGAILLATGLLFIAQRLHFEAVPVPPDGIVADTWGATALRIAVVLAPAALWEELAFRGYLHGVALEATQHALVARLSSSVAFGAIHLMNPGANVRTTGIVVLAGWCLALVRERAGLPAAWTAHLAWNWVMAAVLHVPVSGLPFATPGYRAVLDGPDWLTGGPWGPEGSLLSALVLGGAALGAQRASHSTYPSSLARS